MAQPLATRVASVLLLVGIALLACPVSSAPPQPFSMACPHHVVSELHTLPLQDWEAPSGWSQDTTVYGYQNANLPLLRSSAFSGQLYCQYGAASGKPFGVGFLPPPSGYWIARIRQATPRGFWCSPVNDSDFIGFDCTPW